MTVIWECNRCGKAMGSKFEVNYEKSFGDSEPGSFSGYLSIHGPSSGPDDDHHYCEGCKRRRYLEVLEEMKKYIESLKEVVEDGTGG